jgi:hypothetical protein
MDTFNYVIHNYEWKKDVDNIPEMTRVAFKNLFDDSTDSRLVASWIVERCRWANMTETNDGIMEAKQNSTRNVVIGIINELNKEPVVLQEPEQEA